MIVEQSEHIIREIQRAFMGKDAIIRRVLTTIYAGGHVLLEETPQGLARRRWHWRFQRSWDFPTSVRRTAVTGMAF